MYMYLQPLAKLADEGLTLLSATLPGFAYDRRRWLALWKTQHPRAAVRSHLQIFHHVAGGDRVKVEESSACIQRRHGGRTDQVRSTDVSDFHFDMLLFLFLNPTGYDTLTSGVFAGADAAEGENR
jgi:hypothetical protein